MATNVTNAMFFPNVNSTNSSKQGCWSTILNKQGDKYTVTAMPIGQLKHGEKCQIVSQTNTSKPASQQVAANNNSLIEKSPNHQITDTNGHIDSQKDIIKYEGKLLLKKGGYEILYFFKLPYAKQDVKFDINNFDTYEQQVFTFPIHYFPGIDKDNASFQNEINHMSNNQFNYGAILKVTSKVQVLNSGTTNPKENQFIDRHLLVLFKAPQVAAGKLIKTQEFTTFTITINNKKRTYTRIVHKGAHGAKFVKFNGKFQRLQDLKRYK